MIPTVCWRIGCWARVQSGLFYQKRRTGWIEGWECFLACSRLDGFSSVMAVTPVFRASGCVMRTVRWIRIGSRLLRDNRDRGNRGCI